MKKILLLTGLWIFLITSLSAKIHLPRIIQDHMVLQQNQPVPIWGWADKGEKITLRFQDQVLKTRADESGKWKTELAPLIAGGPFEMTIKGQKETLTLKDILIGEVWICSGQSNMEWPLFNTDNGEAVVQAADHPQIRLFDVPHNIQLSPVEDITSGEWAVCTPNTARNFSAVAYYFGKHLHKNLNVPIGLISSNWGGTIAETWISPSSIAEMEDFKEELASINLEAFEKEKMAQKAKFDAIMKDFGATDGGLINGKAHWAANELDVSTWKTMQLPQLWENAGLAGLDGIVWFRKTFEIPAFVAKNGGKLYLGPIDDGDITWINGKEVGRIDNVYDKPREYSFGPRVLNPGKNVVTVRVSDFGGGGGIWGSADQLRLESDDFSVSLAGDWQYRISPIDLKVADATMGPNDKPTLLYNGMIHPLLPFAFQGVIWYQGESNAGRAFQYRTVFPGLIKDWRKLWGRELPFLFVQLANFKAPQSNPGESDWAELREAQSMTLSLPKTGMAVITDIGEANDIHPRNKLDVGERLALSARKIAYGQNIVYSGPTYKAMKVEGKTIAITFDNTGSGLIGKGKYGYVKGFAIAGADRKFYWAQAQIEGNQIIVHSPKVSEPVAVRYGWADNPDDANLYNKEGLPASPFRTDTWEGITFGKK